MASSLRLAAAGFALAFTGLTGCALIYGYSDYSGAGGAGGQGGSASRGSASASSGSSGSSGAGGASSVSAAVGSSSSGECSSDPPDMMMGDCQSPKCVGGTVMMVINNSDKPPDTGNGCTKGACAGGVPTMNVQLDGLICMIQGMPGNCCKGACVVVAGCMDLCKNGMETDVDCGGTVCQGCGINQMCDIDMDCESMKCDLVTNRCKL